MRAGKQNCIDVFVSAKNIIDMLLYKIVSALRLMFIILYQWHPHGTGFLFDPHIREKLFDLYFIGIGLHRSVGGQYADAVGVGMRSNGLCCRTYHAQYPCRRVKFLQVFLLDRSQSFCRRRIAGKNDQRAILFQQPFNTLQCITVHGFKTSRSVR